MPFPFLPFGALLALAVLGGAFAAFALALRLLDRAGLTGPRSIASGIAAGLRGWSDAGEPGGRWSSPDGDEVVRVPSPSSSPIDDLDAPQEVLLERVRRR